MDDVDADGTQVAQTLLTVAGHAQELETAAENEEGPTAVPANLWLGMMNEESRSSKRCERTIRTSSMLRAAVARAVDKPRILQPVTCAAHGTRSVKDWCHKIHLHLTWS